MAEAPTLDIKSERHGHPSRRAAKPQALHADYRRPSRMFSGMHSSSDKRQQARIEWAEDEVQRG